jgi:hypothetical protein
MQKFLTLVKEGRIITLSIEYKKTEDKTYTQITSKNSKQKRSENKKGLSICCKREGIPAKSKAL